MARLSLQHASSTEWVNATFETHRETQYTRDLLFSSVVDLMALVAVGLRPSLHAAMKKTHRLAVSVGARHAKVQGVEPAMIQALVAGSATHLAAVMAPLAGVGVLARHDVVDEPQLRVEDDERLAGARGAAEAAQRREVRWTEWLGSIPASSRGSPRVHSDWEIASRLRICRDRPSSMTRINSQRPITSRGDFESLGLSIV